MKTKRGGPLWVENGRTAIGFAGSGMAKIIGASLAKEAFARWGYPREMRYGIGFLKLAGAALLLSRRTAWIGASGLTILMLGASRTRFIHRERLNALVPMATLYPLAKIALKSSK